MTRYLAAFLMLLALGAADLASAGQAPKAPKMDAKAEVKAEVKAEAKNGDKDEPHSAKKCLKICMKEIDDRDKCNNICDQSRPYPPRQ